VTCTCGQPMRPYIITEGTQWWLYWACSKHVAPECETTRPVSLPPSLCPPIVRMET
jgi:hypothetical protein